MPRPKNPLAQSKQYRASIALIVLGIALLSYFFIHRVMYWRSLQTSASQISPLPTHIIRASVPVHIAILWYVDSPVESMALTNGNWEVSPEKTSFLSQSARPGEGGNIILYGHNTRKILGNIRALKGGEIITLTTEDGKAHQYKVERMKESDPSDVSWLQPTDSEVLTLYTCSGIFDSKRFLVRAVPIYSD